MSRFDLFFILVDEQNEGKLSAYKSYFLRPEDKI